MTPPLEYIDCSLPHEAMTLGEYRRTRVSAAGAAPPSALACLALTRPEVESAP